jgi:hypothetical protein
VPTRSRKDEVSGPQFRSGDRCFVINGEWYLATREGIEVGPFLTRKAVESASRELIELLKDTDSPQIAALRVSDFARRVDSADPNSQRASS